jgi:arabinogalactan endo-1,4-beta-galactosidase
MNHLHSLKKMWTGMKKRILIVCFILAGMQASNGSSPQKTSHHSFKSIQFIKGADLSFLPQIEDLGGVYKDNNTPKDALKIFKDHGFNCIRLKLWHTPAENYNNLEKILMMARRIEEQDMQFLLDFHYSDTWADPGKQTKPAAWQKLPFAVLKDSVFNYTKKVIRALYDQNTVPEMVQIGNEITPGLLWNDGRVGGTFDTPAQWKNLADLLKAASEGIRTSCDAGDSIRIMIHLDRGGDNRSCRWYFDNLLQQNVQFDVIGLSFYPWWHGTLDQLKANLNDLAVRYGKDLNVVETAYPWTLQWFDGMGNIVGNANQLHAGYPAAVNGQAAFLKDLINIISTVKNNKGQGLVYWEPEYISVPPIGSPWENNTLFDFHGNVLPSMDVFKDESAIGENDDEQDVKVRDGFQLLQNYPNPFNNQTRIQYIVDKMSMVTARIVDIQGRWITTLVEQLQPAGSHSILWNGCDETGAALASGVYFIRLNKNDGFQMRKILLLR